ncbi:glucose-1-phosphate adenylyltransferase [Actinoplanes subtropicus]|uniref:glucose-1-phosphate adenylyltransferase n=1 Tax=Actinoplanes subtropicus TaxID=543632 RepID=UPI0004C324C7|nr:glucose-1-phosphate adenylyltransferase [Actinoplanes subtropicus]
MRTQRILGIVLAGGEGRRLRPLTAERAKPAVPFGGGARLIDFVLSNLVNGGLRRLYVLTQYKSHSLDRHLATAWAAPPSTGQFVVGVPAQQRLGARWYAGSADALFQSLHLIHDDEPDHVAVFGADHIYRMDPAQMIAQHVAAGADVTVAGLRVPRSSASAFGCLDAGADGRIHAFVEKPVNPPARPLVSMGNYVFRTAALLAALRADAADPASGHDVGGDLIPRLVAGGRAYLHDFADNEVAGQPERERGYWRDVGTLDAYYDAHRDLLTDEPAFELHNPRWPILPGVAGAPARVIGGGRADGSLLAPGVSVRGSVSGSVLGAGAVVERGAVVRDSVLLPGVHVGKGAVVRRAIVDSAVRVGDGVELGVDAAADAELYRRSPAGIVAVGKGTDLESV